MLSKIVDIEFDRVMTELKDELLDLNPSSILDFGSGPGTASLAAWNVWGMEGGTFVNAYGEERWEEGSAHYVSHRCSIGSLAIIQTA